MPHWVARILCAFDGHIWPIERGSCLRCGKFPGALTYL